jgi:hypothetical protein
LPDQSTVTRERIRNQQWNGPNGPSTRDNPFKERANIHGYRTRTFLFRLLSRDRGFYRKLFPSLDLQDPAEVNKGD